MKRFFFHGWTGPSPFRRLQGEAHPAEAPGGPAGHAARERARPTVDPVPSLAAIDPPVECGDSSPLSSPGDLSPGVIRPPAMRSAALPASHLAGGVARLSRQFIHLLLRRFRLPLHRNQQGSWCCCRVLDRNGTARRRGASGVSRRRASNRTGLRAPCPVHGPITLGRRRNAAACAHRVGPR